MRGPTALYFSGNRSCHTIGRLDHVVVDGDDLRDLDRHAHEATSDDPSDQFDRMLSGRFGARALPQHARDGDGDVRDVCGAKRHPCVEAAVTVGEGPDDRTEEEVVGEADLATREAAGTEFLIVPDRNPRRGVNMSNSSPGSSRSPAKSNRMHIVEIDRNRGMPTLTKT